MSILYSLCTLVRVLAQYMCTHSRNIGIRVVNAVGCMQGSAALPGLKLSKKLRSVCS